MTEFFRRKMAFFRQVHAFVVKTVRSLAGAIRVTDAVAGNAQAVVVEGDAWVRNQLVQATGTLALNTGRKYAFYDNGVGSILTNTASVDVVAGEDMLVDLTQLCNGDAAKIAAITSWSDLVAQYPEYASYVAHNTGTVVGLQSTVVARGRNLIDDRIKNNPSQTWTLIGSTTLGGGALLPPGKYYWNVYYNGGAMPSGVTPYISYNGRTEYRPHSFTLTEPSYVHCRIYPSQQNTEWSSYTAQVELGSTASPYEPYYYGGTASTQTLYAAGTAHDTQDVVSGEVTRRIGVVDMGTLDWATNGLRFYATVEGMVGYPGSTKIANILCHRYIARALVDSMTPRMYIDNSNKISVVDDNYTDKNTFKAAMSGVMLYYELATPTTSTVTAQPLALQKGSNSVCQTDAGRTASFEMTYTATQ